MTTETLPPLPFEEWEETKKTLHLCMQIVGKIRLAYMPAMNHWWHVPFYVSARGLTTGAIPYGDRTFDIEFDLIAHELAVRVSDGTVEKFPLEPRTVADFYARMRSLLESLGIPFRIIAKPFGIPITEPFPTDTIHASYDPAYVRRFWDILSQIDAVFKEFRGRFIGKCSPVHFFWHSFDIAVTRFSGRAAPVSPEADPVTREAYSHEVISCGFWAGDDKVREPMFYLYSHPEPPGLAAQELRPAEAFWSDAYGGSMAMLRYDDLRRSNNPRETLLDFLQSGYEAAATLAEWDRTALEREAPVDR